MPFIHRENVYSFGDSEVVSARDVIETAYVSPIALFHSAGEYSEEKGGDDWIHPEKY